MRCIEYIYHYWGILKSMLWLFFHPQLWHKGIGVSGMPTIDGITNLKIGKNVFINKNVYIQCVGLGSMEIGDYVTLSYGCVILTSGLDTVNYPNKFMKQGRFHRNEKVKIGNGVWIGARAIVLPGVTIADKIIVGAGAVVTHDLDREGWLYAGVPARPIKPLV